MAILVDDALWWRHERHWCHMVSDHSYDELHAFAQVLGVPERGFHRDHYDIPVHVRAVALEMGALAVPSRELVRRLRASGLRAVSRGSVTAGMSMEVTHSTDLTVGPTDRVRR